MIWLFMAVWMNGHSPSDYKIVAKIGPFETMEQCYSAGALSADVIQNKDAVSNAIGACKKSLPILGTVFEPSFLDMHGMWDMVCLSQDKPEMCWLQNGQFVDPLADISTPRSTPTIAESGK